MICIVRRKLLCLIPLLLLAACSWRGPQPARTGAQLAQIETVLVLDEAAWDQVQVEHHRAARNAAGRMEVSLELSNRSDRRAMIMVRTLFQEYDGSFSDGEPVWESLSIPAGGSVVYSCTSFTNRAALYTVEIKTP